MDRSKSVQQKGTVTSKTGIKRKVGYGSFESDVSETRWIWTIPQFVGDAAPYQNRRDSMLQNVLQS